MRSCRRKDRLLRRLVDAAVEVDLLAQVGLVSAELVDLTVDLAIVGFEQGDAVSTPFWVSATNCLMSAIGMPVSRRHWMRESQPRSTAV